ncbi:MAG TPA: precorrin-4 C(11)-methyltransferase [Gemmataceae bacterium]|nr:precorrin-4 C(11)-methyltransferase [Gemmataceae bacterium]
MNSSMKAALIAVTRGGLEQARRLRARLKLGEIHRPAHLGDSARSWEHSFTGALSEQVPALFAGCDQLIFFLAAGAVTRLIAPCLVSKTSDPGVLVVDEAGHFVISLLSGHQGGANAFARTVAGCLGATPVITTASDVLGGFHIDELMNTYGWIAEPEGRLKATAAALVNHEPVAIVQEIGGRGCWLDETALPDNVIFAHDVRGLQGRRFERVLWITDRLVQDCHGLDEQRILWLRPPSLALGVGCERGISTEALADGLVRFLHEHRVARASIHMLASVDLKEDETALLELAKRHDWQTAFYSPDELARVSGIRNPSPVVEKCVGTPGVAEPAALLAAGAPCLLVEKQVVTSPLSPRRMTFALARLAAFHERTAAGRVIFAGAGPGDPELLTLKAREVLRRAEVIIYAGSLVPEAVLRHAPATAVLHNSAHLTLEQVMEITKTAVNQGRCVVRLHSGDTSLYSAIQEQLAVLEDAGIDCEVIPGISSFQATAAVLKSELTLPEIVQTVILTRGEGLTKMPPGESLASLAQHKATLCIFLSARLAEEVQAQLLTAYPPQTPAAIAYRISWPDEQIIITTLSNLAEEVHRHRLTRTALFLVGEAIGGRRNRSRLYDRTHGHLFRARSRDETHPSLERDE